MQLSVPTNTTVVLTLLRSALIALALLSAADVSAAERPHIVYITLDDLGWRDVGYHGGRVQTPTIDRLAHDGLRLEQFYVQPFSSQTRAAVATGRYPMRYGLQTLQIQHFSQFGLPVDERTLAKALKEAGYRTDLVGKWHLGHARKEFWPTQRGYDSFYGHLGGEIDSFRKVNRAGEPDWHRGEKAVTEDGYVPALLAKEAAGLIARHDPATPLFLHVAFAAPQAPLQASKDILARYRDVKDPDERAYRAMVTAVDSAVAAIVSALESKRLLESTLILLHSTTGGAVNTKFPTGDGDARKTVASNGHYRDGRGNLHEGGLRAVAFLHWPGKIQPGVSTELMHAVDLYPTLLTLAGAKLEQPKPIDGLDMWPTLSEGKPSPRKEVLLNVEDLRGAIRMGDWKLIVYAQLPGRLELYNLKADPSEEDNQAEREGERVQSMLKRLNDYAWDMAPSKYLEELAKPRRVEAPMFWGDNPARP
jgi:arylsulfatase A-like enzyme